MGKELSLKNQLTDVRLEKIGLCRSPAVPEATHVLMKTREGEVSPAGDPHTRIGDEQNFRDIAKTLESAVGVLSALLGKALGRGDKQEEQIKETENDMDISKATPDDIQKANPELFAAIMAKAVPSLKEKDGQKPGESVQDAVAEKDGEKSASAKVSGKVDGAVTEKKPTVSGSECCKADEAVAAEAAEAPEAVEAEGQPLQADKLAELQGAQVEMAKSIQQLQKGLGEMMSNLTALTAGRKQDESLAKAADVAALAKSVETLTKSAPGAEFGERFANVEKALAKMIRDSRMAKSAEQTVAKSEQVAVAKSAQAGELDENSAKQETPVGKSKTLFAGTISTLCR